MPLSNASRLADFGTGIGTAGAIIQVDNANQRLGVGTTAPTATLGVAGIVSATAFYGDGSNLDGVASAGLGTALSEEEFNPLTVIYQTSDTLSVGATITVDPPDATTKVAYTQYAEVKLEGDADLIVADGDDFIPDILGLSTEGFSFSNANGNGIFDTVYTDNIENAAGRGAPNFPLGITVTGISTLSGNVSIGGTLTYEDVTNVDSIGVVTARNGIKVTTGGIDVTAGGVTVTAGDIDVISGSIGIGEDNPDGNKLIIRGASTIGTNKGHIMLTGDGATVGEGPQIVFSESGGGDNWAGAYIGHTREGGGSVGDLRFGTRGVIGDANTIPTERLRISNTGAIGIAGANYGTSGQVLTSQGNSASPQWATVAGGLSEYDQWQCTDHTETNNEVWDFDIIGSSNPNGGPVTLARTTTSQNPRFAKIGTGMSFSAGIWTFPSTGYWEVIMSAQLYTTQNATRNFRLETTENNSTYTTTATMQDYGGLYWSTTHNWISYFNITDVSNQKIRYLFQSSGANCSWYGANDQTRTNWIFKKVG